MLYPPPLAHRGPEPPRALDSTPGNVVRRLRVAMGTTVAIEARAHSEGAARSALESAFAAVTDVEGRMHPQQHGSDVQRINTASPGERCPIHASTRRVLELARRLHSASDGVFDPCLPQRAGRLDDLELSPFELQGDGWVICHAPVALDLGGIAKGYAVDRATDALIAAGCEAGLVNAGGDLRLFGTEHRTVLLRHGGATYQPLVLENTALAVTDLDAPRRPSGHRGYYVRSANTPPLRRYAAVLAPQAALADALTKCALLCPPERAGRIFREFGAREAG